jgi:hypothetical protein
MQEGDAGTKSLYIPPIRPLLEKHAANVIAHPSSADTIRCASKHLRLSTTINSSCYHGVLWATIESLPTNQRCRERRLGVDPPDPSIYLVASRLDLKVAQEGPAIVEALVGHWEEGDLGQALRELVGRRVAPRLAVPLVCRLQVGLTGRPSTVRCRGAEPAALAILVER